MAVIVLGILSPCVSLIGVALAQHWLGVRERKRLGVEFVHTIISAMHRLDHAIDESAQVVIRSVKSMYGLSSREEISDAMARTVDKYEGLKPKIFEAQADVHSRARLLEVVFGRPGKDVMHAVYEEWGNVSLPDEQLDEAWRELDMEKAAKIWDEARTEAKSARTLIEAKLVALCHRMSGWGDDETV